MYLCFFRKIMVNKLNPQLEDLKQFLSKVPDLELAILIGSQVTGTAHDQSDWDIAVRWHQQAEISIIKLLGRPEVLRHDLAQFLNVSNEQIDLIDLTNVGLTMRAVVAEEGLVLKGEATLAWWGSFLNKHPDQYIVCHKGCRDDLHYPGWVILN